MMLDYYELLQISPNADNETIHRVYKYLAARLHPDNTQTGDAAKFRQVKAAYDALSHTARRTEYDAKRRESVIQPLSLSIDFMDQLDGEINRRIAVLALLYYRRRTSPNFPEVSLAEIEERMGFPRDYLDFTLWYLVRKNYISKADNACYALTAEGVDFIEKERAVRPVLNGLLTSSVGTVLETVEEIEETPDHSGEAGPIDRRATRGATRVTSSATENSKTGRRKGEDDRRSGTDRRMGAPDLRAIKIERRQTPNDRRAISKDRRAAK